MGSRLAQVTKPVLLIVGASDDAGLGPSLAARSMLAGEVRLQIVSGAQGTGTSSTGIALRARVSRTTRACPGPRS